MASLRLCIVAVVLLTGCAGSRSTFPDRAIIEVSSITEAIQIENEVNARSDKIPPDGVSWFQIVEGDAPIVVTAPHSTKPFRNGEYRYSDGGGTAALARLLNKLTGVTVIYATYSSPSDPNYYDDNEFKRALEKIIKTRKPNLIIDIHGSQAYRPYDIDLGTMGGDSLLGNDKLAIKLMEALKAEGLANASYNYFAASRNQTITKFSSRLGVPAIQLEISRTWLTPSQGDLAAHRFSQLLQGVVRYIEVEKRDLQKASSRRTSEKGR